MEPLHNKALFNALMASSSPANAPHSPERIRQHAEATVALDGAPEASPEEVERVARAIHTPLGDELLQARRWTTASPSGRMIARRSALAAIRAMRGVGE